MLDSGQRKKRPPPLGDSGAGESFLLGDTVGPSDRVEFQCRAGVEVKIQVRGRLQLCDAGVQLFTLVPECPPAGWTYSGSWQEACLLCGWTPESSRRAVPDSL